MSRLDRIPAHEAPLDASTANTRLRLAWVQYEATAKWVRKGMVVAGVTDSLDRIRDAIDLGLLDANDAVEFVRDHLGWVQAHLLRNGHPPRIPPADVVRDYWRKLPPGYLTVAERELAEAEIARLKAGVPPSTGKTMPLYADETMSRAEADRQRARSIRQDEERAA